jgi:GxxExxY protein
MKSKKGILYDELSYEVLGCAYEAFKAVEVGYDEFMYHQIFHDFLLKKGLNARYKVPLHLDYLGERIADLQADEIIEDKIIVELKGIQTAFLPENYAQLMTYLKITKLRLGFLINFGLHKAYPERIIFDEKRKPVVESWDNVFFQHPSTNKLEAVITSLRNIDQALGAAYHRTIYEAALRLELKRQQTLFDDTVCIHVKVGNIKFKPFEIDFWLVEKAFLLGVLAGKDKPRAYDLLRMRSYLRRLNLHHGLIAYWSTNNLQLYGIYER